MNKRLPHLGAESTDPVTKSQTKRLLHLGAKTTDRCSDGHRAGLLVASAMAAHLLVSDRFNMDKS
jgi:hypothetical protein